MDSSGIPQKKPVLSVKSGVIFFVAIIGVAGMAMGGFLYWKSRISSEKPSVTQEEPTPTVQEATPTPTATPSPVPEEPVELSAYTIEVLNGSGIPGEAGRVKGLLEEAGFEEVLAGNAGSYDYKETEVMVKSDTPEEVLTAVKEALAELSLIDGDSLEDSYQYDVKIIVGSTKS